MRIPTSITFFLSFFLFNSLNALTAYDPRNEITCDFFIYPTTSSVQPLLAESFLGAEFNIHVKGLTPVPNTQDRPLIEFDGENYLAVWMDDASNSNELQIYGTRLDIKGEVIDEKPFFIGSGTPTSLIFDGTNYFLAYYQHKSWDKNNVLGVRISPEGTILEPAKINISTGSQDELSPSVSFDGEIYFVVWQDDRNSGEDEDNASDIYGARISQNGEVLDPEGIEICSVSKAQRYPVVKFNGDQHLVVWEDNRNDPSTSSLPTIINIFGIRVSKDGSKLDSSEFNISGTDGWQQSPHIVKSGNDFIVLWKEIGTDTKNIYSKKVTSDGTVSSNEKIKMSDTDSVIYFSVASSSTQNLVTWQNENDADTTIFGSEFNGDGTLVGETITANNFSSHKTFSTAASDGKNFIILWTDFRYGYDEDYDYDKLYGDIFGTIINDEGIVLDEAGFPASLKKNNSFFPAISSNGDSYLVVWKSDKNIYSASMSDIYNIIGTRINENGEILDQGGIDICSSDNDQHDPDVASDGENYLVLWTDFRDEKNMIYGNRISSKGEVLDGEGFPISKDIGSFASVIFDGNNYFAVWSEQYAFQSYSVKGAFINKSGSIIKFITVAEDINPYVQTVKPRAAFDGENYAVVYSGYSGNRGVYVSILSEDGNFILENTYIRGSEKFISHPDISFDGNRYLIVWSQYSDNSRKTFGCFMNTEGTIENKETPILISNSDGSMDNPRVSFDGYSHFVLWEDSRDDPDTTDLDIINDVYGIRISVDGNILGKEFPVKNNEHNHSYPVLNSDMNGKTAILYMTDERSDIYDPVKINGKFFVANPGDTCETSFDCSSSLCVDGVCCLKGNCDDNNPCTIDSCSVSGNGTCTNLPGNEGMPCIDDDPDTFNEVCVNGECTTETGPENDTYQESNDDSDISTGNNENDPESNDNDSSKDSGCAVIVL